MQIFVLTNIYSIPEGPIAVKFCLTTFKTNLFQSLVQNLPDMLQICLIGRGIFSFLIGNSFLNVCTSFWCFSSQMQKRMRTTFVMFTQLGRFRQKLKSKETAHLWLWTLMYQSGQHSNTSCRWTQSIHLHTTALRQHLMSIQGSLNMCEKCHFKT